MSVAVDFRALLAGNAGVAALVGARIALNAVPQGSAIPLVVFGVAHERTLGLDNTLLAEQCAVTVQCWADTAAGADALADAVEAAVATAAATRGAVVLSRAPVYSEELGLDGVALAVDWWG
jgi:hypothetical protein